jgi:DNA-binding Lrp family transcriptional regulator
MVRTSGGSAVPGGDEPAIPARPAMTHEPGPPAERHALDDVDRRILALVARDARLSVRAIGREMRMSPGAISDRIDRMERAGVIRGYHADIDPAAIGYGTEVFVGLRTQQGPHLGDAIAQLAAVPEVASIHVVTGQWDVVVRLRVRDHQHLRDLLLSQMWQVSGFLHSETLLVLESHGGPPDWFARTMPSEPPLP